MEIKDDMSVRRKPISECIITDKIFFQCFQRECMPETVVELPESGGPFTFVDVTFQPGSIVEGTLNITPMDEPDPTLNRIAFTLRIPFTVRVRNAGNNVVTINSSVDFFKDDVIRIPENPYDEFAFNVVVETRSEVLRTAIRGDTLELAIGSLIVTKIVGRVELTVLSTGYCVPCPCDEFIPEDLCNEFLELPFEQIFPEQLSTPQT